jgi:putative ATP-binding cassette transporter
MNILYHHIRKSMSFLVLAVVAGVVSGASTTALIATIHMALSTEGPAKNRYFAAFAALCVLVPVTRFVSGTVLVRLGQRIMFNLRMQLCRQILNAPLRQLEEIGPARLLSSFSGDIISITNIIVNFPILCMSVAVVVGSLGYVGWLSPTVLVTLLAFVTLGIFCQQFLIRRAQGAVRQSREAQDAVFREFRTLTDGNKELKLHHRRGEAFINDAVRTAAADYRRHTIASMDIYNGASSWSQMLFFVLIGLLVFGVPYLRDVGNQVLTGCILAFLYMVGSLEQIMGMLPGVGMAKAAMRKMEMLGLSLDASSEGEAAGDLTPDPNWKSLELSNVVHSYRTDTQEHPFVLGPLSMALRPGELLFLVGGNGSGKTTLAKLLTGLYAPESGEIRIDGRPVNDENRRLYRQHFSVVFYDFYLFEKFLGLDAPDFDKRASRYLSTLLLDNKVVIRDGALSTTDLSQGQRKRLALLTAYLEDRPIYLFDEWAADQDPMFKEFFYRELLPELKARGKTIIVISHDDRYYDVADRIVKLDSGQLVSDTRGRVEPWLASAVEV